MRKLRKLIFKLFCIVFLLWGIFGVFQLANSLREYLSSNEKTFETRDYHNNILNTLSRDKLLQDEFKKGQELLKALRFTTIEPQVIFQHKMNSEHHKIPSDVDPNLLTPKIKKLIESGLIVPRWNLIVMEVPSTPDAPGLYYFSFP